MARKRPASRRSGDRFERGVLSVIPGVAVNGGGAPRLGNTSNLTFHCVEGESLVLAMDQAGFALSSPICPAWKSPPGRPALGAFWSPPMCSRPSGLRPNASTAASAFPFGHFNTEADVDFALRVLPAAVTHLRRMSPLWEDRGRTAATS